MKNPITERLHYSNTYFVEKERRHVEQEPVTVFNDKEGSKFDADELLRAAGLQAQQGDEVYVEIKIVSRLRTVREPVK